MNTTDPAKLKEFISKAFVESGEQYTLYTKTKQLLTESGWTAQVQSVCQGTFLTIINLCIFISFLCRRVAETSTAYRSGTAYIGDL